MDEIQRVLIKAGRKDQAQEYYKKIKAGSHGHHLNWRLK